jgi:hypothetical protein
MGAVNLLSNTNTGIFPSGQHKVPGLRSHLATWEDDWRSVRLAGRSSWPLRLAIPMCGAKAAKELDAFIPRRPLDCSTVSLGQSVSEPFSPIED